MLSLSKQTVGNIKFYSAVGIFVLAIIAIIVLATRATDVSYDYKLKVAKFDNEEAMIEVSSPHDLKFSLKKDGYIEVIDKIGNDTLNLGYNVAKILHIERKEKK